MTIPAKAILTPSLAENFVSVMHKIEAESGIITASTIVDEARDENSPIHSMFEWDDSIAAETYRRSQATTYICQVRITIQDRKIPAFYNVRVTQDDIDQKGFVSFAQVQRDDSFKDQVLRKAVTELSAWQQRYENLEEVLNLVNLDELENVKKKIG